jgi:hypothetical protein
LFKPKKESKAMPSLKEIIANLLMKELIGIRTDTLKRMLAWLKHGQLQEANEEGAKGKLDNKGAISIPGGINYLQPPYGSRTRIST